MNEELRVRKIVEDVADARPVDWRSESGKGASASLLTALRTIERIGSAYRDITIVTEESGRLPQTLTYAAGLPSGPVSAHHTWGRLRILEQVDAGGYGEVYRAHDPVLDKTVALKLPLTGAPAESPESSSLLDEARRLARVRHPNVLTVHGADVVDGRVGIWTDFIEGETLEARLRREGPFGPEEAALIGIDLCAALAAVHAAQLVHRDVKTKNVMRAKGGRTILLDFSAVEERSSRQPAFLTGTLHYMAPELLRGERSGPASDIYALGVLLYRLVTGLHPIESTDRTELRHKTVRGEWRPLRDVRPDLPPGFAAVVERARAHDPADRYASAGVMERALAATVGVVRGDGTAVRARRKPIALAAGLFVLAAMGGAAAWLMLGGKAEPLAVEAALMRSGSKGDEPLAPGSTVRVGDRIALEFTGSRPLHLYVFDQDRDGIVVLHPLSDIGAVNPLRPGVKHRLPGGGAAPRSWAVTSDGGQESILAIASAEPLPQIEEAVRALPKALLDRAPLTSSASAEPIMRGLGAVVDDPTLGTESQFSDVYLRLYEAASRKEGIWVWQITLHGEGAGNPAAP